MAYIKKGIILFSVFILMISLFSAGSVFAQSNGDGEEKNTSKKSTISIKAGRLQNEKDLIFFSDGLEIKKDDITLKSPEGEFDDNENKIILKDGVEMLYSEGTINSDKMTGYFDDDEFIFENKVKMKYKSEEDENKNFDLESKKLQINSESQSFTANENVVINYDKKVIKANKAKYDSEKELLVVTNDVHIKKENGDWVKSDRAEFDLSTGEQNFSAEGNVEIEITL